MAQLWEGEGDGRLYNEWHTLPSFLPCTVRVAGSLSTPLPRRTGLMARQTYCPASPSSTAEMLSVLLTCVGDSMVVDTLSRGESPGDIPCESCVQ